MMNTLLPRLQEAIESLGHYNTKSGVYYEYKSEHGLPLGLYVNAVGPGFRTMVNPSVMVCLLSTCCSEIMAHSWEVECTVMECTGCYKMQPWAPPEVNVSLTRDRALVLTYFEHALQALCDMNPLEASFAALSTVMEIETMHKAYFTPKWAAKKAVEVLGITHRIEIKRKAR